MIQKTIRTARGNSHLGSLHLPISCVRRMLSRQVWTNTRIGDVHDATAAADPIPGHLALLQTCIYAVALRRFFHILKRI